MSPDMKNKVCLITGASTGIGYVTALELARMGATVIMVNRDLKRGERARSSILRTVEKANVELMLCDLASQEQIRRLAGELSKRHSKLHVLVNNAAIVPSRRTLTEDGLETQFAVNHLAPFLLTNLLLDKLKAGAPSRVVTVSSGMHRTASLDFDNLQAEKKYRPMKHYALTKLLNIYFTFELAERLKGGGVTANCLAPGFTATNLGRDFSPFSRFVMKHFAKPKEKGAETVVLLASAHEVEGITGKYFDDKKEVETSTLTHDRDIARRLWELSMRLTRMI